MSARRQQSYLAREGWFAMFLLVVAALLLFKLIGPLASLPAWLSLLVLGYLYRDPERRIPPLPLAVISPVDGKVVFVKKDNDPYLNRPAIRIRLQIHRLGIFGLRSPIEGKMLEQWLYKPGQGDDVAPHLDQPAGDDRHYVMWIQTDEQDDIVLILEIPSSWQKPQCYVHVGERIGQGQRCGRTRFGGYVEIFMPDNVRLEVGHGDHVTAGTSVLATMVH